MTQNKPRQGNDQPGRDKYSAAFDRRRGSHARQDTEIALRIKPALQLLFSVLSLLLMLRFVFALFAVPSGNPLVLFVTFLTDPLAAPFENWLQLDSATGPASFESGTLLAIIVYLLTGFVILKLLEKQQGD